MKQRREKTFWALVFIACVLTAMLAYIAKSFLDEASDSSPMMFSPYEQRTKRTIHDLEEQMIRTEKWERDVQEQNRREEERLRRQSE